MPLDIVPETDEAKVCVDDSAVLLLATCPRLPDEIWRPPDTGELLGKPLLKLLLPEAAGTPLEETLKPPEVDVLENEADTEAVPFGRENEAVVFVSLEETLELEADEERADIVNVPGVVELVDRLKLVELVRPEVVVKFARRLDAEADDELGATVGTPTLSALMMSAAFWHRQPASTRAARCANSPFLQQRRQLPEDAPRVSLGRCQHQPLLDSGPHALEGEGPPRHPAQVVTSRRCRLHGILSVYQY